MVSGSYQASGSAGLAAALRGSRFWRAGLPWSTGGRGCTSILNPTASHADSLVMTVGIMCHMPECGERRLRGFLFCWSHQLEIDILEEETPRQTTMPDNQDFVWMCQHGSIMGDCFLSSDNEFPGLSRSQWEMRAEMSGITLNLN